MSARTLGFYVGDLVFTGGFPGILISEANTNTPTCEVFGLDQEIGSAYATDLRHLPTAEFLDMLRHGGYRPPLKVWSDESLKALRTLGIPAERA